MGFKENKSEDRWKSLLYAIKRQMWNGLIGITVAAIFFLFSTGNYTEAVILVIFLSVTFLIHSELHSHTAELLEALGNLPHIKSSLEAVVKKIGANIGSYIWAKHRCSAISVTYTQDVGGVRKIYIKCSKGKMTRLGCPDFCDGYTEIRPTGGLTLGGMIIGGALGLIGGPLGVIVGGVAGGVVGARAEELTTMPRLEVEISNAKAYGKTPQIIIESVTS